MKSRRNEGEQKLSEAGVGYGAGDDDGGGGSRRRGAFGVVGAAELADGDAWALLLALWVLNL